VSSSVNPGGQASDEHKTLVEIPFTEEQRDMMERASGLTGLTGVRLVDLNRDARMKLSPGLARATVTVLCW
jgi:hypothetical protein